MKSTILFSVAAANVNFSVDVDTDRLARWGRQVDKWGRQNEAEIQDVAMGAMEFEQLLREYNYEYQAQTAEWLIPLADTIDAYAEYGYPDENCDAEAFGQCLINDPYYGQRYDIFPGGFSSECAKQTACTMPFDNLSSDE